MSLIAKLRDEDEDGTPVVVIEGEIDSSNAVEIGDRLRHAISNQGMALVVDLTPTTYIDSAGINVLFRLGLELQERQQELHLVIASGSPIERMLKIVGLDRAVPTFPTRADALNAL
jgi:anti-sigma B factor antagonist